MFDRKTIQNLGYNIIMKLALPVQKSSSIQVLDEKTAAQTPRQDQVAQLWGKTKASLKKSGATLVTGRVTSPISID